MSSQPETDGLRKTALDLIKDPSYTQIGYEQSLAIDNPKTRHAAHALIYAKQDGHIFHNKDCALKAAVMMQIRFDGTLGFPGGIIDPGENVLQGLNRELHEELRLDCSVYDCKLEDYITSHCNQDWVVHFFAKEVSLEQYQQIEKDSLLSRDYGTEVQGTIRVPLYTLNSRGCGLPLFLKNRFVGNSQEQLLLTLLTKNILTSQEVIDAVKMTCTLNGIKIPS